MEFLNLHETFERNMEEIARKYDNGANRNLLTSTRRPPIRNVQVIQAGMDSYSSSTNQTRFPTPKTSKVDPQ